MTPEERRGLLVAMREHRLRVARVEERLERGPKHHGAGARAATAIVRAHDDPAGFHVAYRTALRTLCGARIERGVHGRGQHREPDCEECLLNLKALRFAGLAGLAGASEGGCDGVTRKGGRCQRSPQPGSLYCWWHRGLESAAA